MNGSRLSPSGPYLLPSDVDWDQERLLGGRERMKNLRDGLLPRAGQASRSADTHPAGGGKTWPGNGGEGCPVLRGW